MRFSTWVYVLIAAVGPVAIWWLGSTGTQQPNNRSLYDLDPQTVTYLKLVNSKGTLTLEKDGDRWMVTEPIKSSADRNSVEPLLQQLATAEYRREITVSSLKTGSLEAWNLEPASIRVTFRAAGKTQELLIGRDVAANNLAYARASGSPQEPVRLISLDLKRAMESGLTDLRSRALFDFDARYTVTAGVRTMNASGQVERECEVNVSNRGWMLQKPVQARADVTKVRDWVNAMLGLTVVDFVTDTSPNPSTYGLSSPSAHIWVVLSPRTPSGLPDPLATSGTTEIALEIGSQVPGKPNLVYAWKPGATSVFTLSGNSVDQLIQGLADVRDRRIFPFKETDIHKLTLQRGDMSFTLTRNEETAWDLVTGDYHWRADKGAVDKMVRRILSEQATRFVKDTTTDLAAYGLDHPQGKISFGLQREKVVTSFEVTLGKIENGQVYIRNSIEPAVVSTSDVFVEGLPSNPLQLRHLQTINLDRDRFVSLEVKKKAGSYVLKRDSNGVMVTDVKGFAVDVDRAEEMSQVFSQLRVAEWVSLPKPEYGLDTPEIVATITAGDPDKPGAEKKAVLRVGSGTLPGGMHYAQVDGEPFVFALAAEDLALLDSAPVKSTPSSGDTPAAPVQPHPGKSGGPAMPGDIPEGRSDEK